MQINEISFAEVEKCIVSQEIKDVHVTTAMRIFKVDAKDVTPEMRRCAKTINHCIAYGLFKCE